MAVTIGTNLFALGAIRNLGLAGNRLQTTFSRLSSGSRLNRPSDDPAALAVSSSLNARVRVRSRAIQNASDGVSLLGIADGALSQISGLLTRMSELSEQSANGVFGSLQRMSLNTEYETLGREIARISSSTTFNGISLFKGSQVGSGFQNFLSVSGTANVVGTSGNGRYIAYKDDFKLYLYDSQTEVSTQLSSNQPSTSGADAFVTSSGDVFFSEVTGTLISDVFHYDHATGNITQLTKSGSNDTVTFSASADGRKVVIAGRTDYVDGATKASGTSGAGSKLYTIDVDSGIFRYVSGSNGVNIAELSVSADGGYLAFVSNTNIAGGNPDGNSEVYSVKIGSSSQAIIQNSDSTATDGFSLVGINRSGKIYMRSARNLGGFNPNNYGQLFEINSLNNQVRMLTSNTTAASLTSRGLSGDGNSLFFVSNGDYVGENPSGIGQVYRLDIDLGLTTQLTKFSSNQTLANSVFALDGSKLLKANGGLVQQLDLTQNAGNFDFEVGEGSVGGILLALDAVIGKIKGLGGYTITSASSARAALDAMKDAIDSVAQSRGIIGAGLSRLQAANSLLRVQVVELGAANGRIADADIGAESSDLVNNQILQNIGSALLAQANIQPRIALQLLGVG